MKKELKVTDQTQLKRIHISLPAQLLRQLDAWRDKQVVPPDRSATVIKAIEELIK